MFRRGTKRPRFSVSGHPVFEHDDSSNHSGLGIADYDDDSLSQQHNASTNSSDQHFPFSHFTPERPRRAPKPSTKPHNYDNTNLIACLDHLLRILSRKDKEGFFQYPVTDQFAPGYSQIITRPMDFSTMRKKINQDEYSNIVEFRSDFELMCGNAMKYNRPDTIYWQAAKKLLAVGTKLMNKDKLLSFRRSLECFSRLTERELGFRIDSSNHTIDEQITTSNEQLDLSITDHDNLSSVSISQACSQRKPKLILKLPKFYDKPPAATTTTTTTIITDEEEEEEDEELPPEEILAQAKHAAQCAREKLSLHRPICSYTLAYQRADGTTSLRYINQDEYSQLTVSIGDLNSSSSNIISTNEKRNHLSSRNFLENGPFSSNASQYDSAFSAIDKDELDLLIHTYGSEFSAQYAVSLMDYVKDAGDLALAYVDRFLSVLTNGEHDNLIMKRREKQQVKEEEEAKTLSANTFPLTSSNESIQISSADQIKLEPQINTNDNIQYQQLDTKLDENSKLFMDLHHPSNALHQIIAPEQTHEPLNEYELAEKVLFNLSDLTQMSNGPEQIISSETIHHNLGIINNNESTFDTL